MSGIPMGNPNPAGGGIHAGNKAPVAKDYDVIPPKGEYRITQRAELLLVMTEGRKFESCRDLAAHCALLT
jgi:hypothetical protein